MKFAASFTPPMLRCLRPLLFVLVAMCSFASLLHPSPADAAVELAVLKDINTDSSGASSSTPQCLVELGGKVYFTAIAPGSTRRQLYSYDPSLAAGAQVTQLSSFAGSAASTSVPRWVRVVGSKIVMTANGSANGVELWEFDPAAGSGSQFTEMSIDGTTTTTNAPTNLLVHGGKLYFSASNGARPSGHGFQLYVYDPAAAKKSLTDANPNPKRITNLATNSSSGGNPANLVGVGDKVLFSANLSYYSNGVGHEGVDDIELVMVDTTTLAVTTFQLADGQLSLTNNGSGYTDQFDSNPLQVRAQVGNALYFSAGYTASPHGSANYRGQVLMKFDPTTMSAPTKVAELNADSGVTIDSVFNGLITSGNFVAGDTLSSAAVLGTKLYYSANNGANGQELFVLDTATDTATLAKDIAAGSTGSSPSGLTVFDGKLYFGANLGAGGGNELVEFNPTGSVITEFAANPNGDGFFGAPRLIELGGKLYFGAAGNGTGTEVHVFDPSARTVSVVYNMNGASDGASNFNSTTTASFPLAIGFNGDLLFQGTVSATGSEVYHFSTPQVAAPVIASSLTASGTYNSALSTYAITASGSPTSYNAIGLPAGLSVNTTNGQITGTPTQVGSFDVTINATNSGGTGSATLVMTIAAAVPTLASPTSASVTHMVATLGGNVTSAGGGTITARGVVLAKTSTNSNPQLAGTGVTHVAGAGTTGVFTVSVTGLTPDTAYSYKSYATNSAGTTYTSIGTFTTAEETQTEGAGAVSPTAINNAQPSLALTWMISLTGAFPAVDENLVTNRFMGEIRAIAYESNAMSGNSGWAPCYGQLLPIAQNAALFSLLGTRFGGNGTTTFGLPDLRGRVPVGTGHGVGLTDRQLGDKGGVETNTLSAANLAPHNHTYNGGNTAQAGSASAIDNMQPWLALNMCMTDYTDPLRTGWIRIFAFHIVPGGHFSCDGTELPLAGFEDLFATVGAAFGGDGTTSFRVPDLRGRTPIGVGQGRGLSLREIGEKGGSETVSLQTSELPLHTHAYSSGNTGGAGGAHAHSTMQPYLVVRPVISGYGSFQTISDEEDGIAEMRLLAWSDAPAPETGWFPSDGALLSIDHENLLFQVTGTTFGGDGENNFATPDLRGRTLVGQGQGSGLTNHMLAEEWGQDGVTITSAQLPAHTHLFASSPVISNNSLIASGTYGTPFSTFTIAATGTVTGYTATGLPSGLNINTANGQITGIPETAGTFNVTIGAANDVGTDTETLVITIAKANQTISWTSLDNKTYGDGTFTVSATSTTGLPVSYSVVSGNATISGNIVTLTGTGAVTLRAEQAGNANYNAAVGANAGFMVGKASATVTLGSLAATYNTAAHAATATTSPTGLTVTFTYNGSATAPTDAGTYAVVGTISDSNYQGSANGTLVIGKAAATVTLGSLSATYNTAAHAATATTSPANLAVDFTYDGNTTAPTNAGSYAVVGMINDANYQGSANGTLAIAKATATVTLGSLSPIYNASARAATATTSPTGRTVHFTYDGNSTAPTSAGSYAVVGTISDANYQGVGNGTLVIAKAPLAVTANAANRTYGATDPGFAATLSGFVGSDTVAVVSGAASFSCNASITSNVGDYTITPMAGTLTATNYAFSTFNAGTLTITKAPLTITADAKSRTYGSTEPSFTATFAGFVNGETAAVITGTAAFSTDALVTSNVASYTITPTLGTLSAMNYSFTFANGTLSVTKATLTVTAAGKTKIYGAANPLFTSTVSGYKNSDTSAVISGTPALTTPADATSAVGSYAIEVAAGSLAATNYSFDFISGTLAVTKATLTVTADDKSRGYGAANPEFTAVVAGFVNDDTLDTATSGAPVLTTTANANSAQGTYAISVAAGTIAAPNYHFSLVNGTLTVTKAVLTVKADNKSKVYGAANPAFTYEIAGYLNHDTATVITGMPALNTTADGTSAVATYQIAVDVSGLSATNYIFAGASGTLTVTKATLTVTADNKTRAYAETDPVFTATIAGYVNNDTAASVDGAPTFTTAAFSTSSVGNYSITPALGSLTTTNYSFDFRHGTLTITPAAATIALSGLARTYDGEPHAAEATTTPQGLPVAFTYSGAATAPSNAGTYDVVATIADPNYSGAATGTLMIDKAAQSISFSSLSGLTIGDSTTLAATASSTLPVAFSVVRGPATLAGRTLATTGVGTVTVRAAQAGNGNFRAAAAVERSFAVALAPATVTTPAQVPTPPNGGTAQLVVTDAKPNVEYHWQRNGADVPNGTGSALTIPEAQPPMAGLYTYTAMVTGGTGGTSEPLIVGISTEEKVIGAAEEIAANILHPNGNTYDQLLLEGTATTFTAAPGKITRISFIDMSQDIVQVEFSGAGTLSLVMDNASSPAPAASYNQAGISYVRGHAGVVITGANETTNVSVFSVGRITAINQALFVDTVDYDGIADIAFVAIQSANGNFGGVRTGNVNYFATRGHTGVYAPGVTFGGPLNIGEISAFDGATPLVVVGSITEARIAGGDLAQPNGAPIRVDGIGRLAFVEGMTSHGVMLPAQPNRGVLQRNGVEVTRQIVVNP